MRPWWKRGEERLLIFRDYISISKNVIKYFFIEYYIHRAVNYK